MLGSVAVHIEVTSTLTQEDENRLAPAVMKLLSGILEMLPVAYLVRIQTTDEHVYQRVNPQLVAWDEVQDSTPDEALRPFVES